MNLIVNTVMQEKHRIEYMIEKYNEALTSLPKGSLNERHVGARTYFYLKYREGEKVVSKYVPADKANEVRDGVDKRRHIETMLAALKKEKELADKILGGAL